MSIDPEQLLALAKSRLHDGGVTLGWPTVVQIVEGLREREALDGTRERLLDERNQALRERDALAKGVDRLNNDLDDEQHLRQRAQDRELALAAQVERLTSIAEKLRTVPPEYLDHLAADAEFVLQDLPTTSLARRDAEAAERALTKAHTRLSERREWSAAHYLLLVASEINPQFRRQAEEVAE
ncbi:hypothetical protein QC589_01670 [Halomonas elongata]|uniref:hypothetical protein n=1 Tax=Halomonas elongata TaxID=2746 RepID=UPI0033457EA3